MPRRQKKYHYIYKTTNLVNGTYYIGMHTTDNLNDGYIGSGKRLWYSINKYGKENFTCEILEMLPNKKLLVKREKELVNEVLLKDEMCLNLGLGGNGGHGSRFLTKKQLQKGGTNSLKKNWENIKFRENQIKKASEQAKKFWANGRFVYRDNLTGKHHKEETKQKIGLSNSIKQKGEKNSQFGTCWITNEIENKKINKFDIIPDGWKLGRIFKLRV